MFQVLEKKEDVVLVKMDLVTYEGLKDEIEDDLSSKEITLLNNNYLDQFYDFLDSSKSGPIGNGTIDFF